MTSGRSCRGAAILLCPALLSRSHSIDMMNVIPTDERFINEHLKRFALVMGHDGYSKSKVRGMAGGSLSGSQQVPHHDTIKADQYRRPSTQSPISSKASKAWFVRRRDWPATPCPGRRLRDTAQAVHEALLHEWAIWRPKLEGTRGLRPPDLGPLPCRSKPMLLAVIVSPSSGTA